MAGSIFLAIYAAVVGMLLVTHEAGRAWLRRRQGAITAALTPAELAFALHGESVAQEVAALPAGAIATDDDGSITPAPLAASTHASSVAVPSALRLVDPRTKQSLDDIVQALRDKGVLVSRNGAQTLQRVTLATGFGVLLAGAIRVAMGISHHKPVGFTVMMMMSVAGFLAWRLSNVMRLRTIAGDALLQRMPARTRAVVAPERLQRLTPTPDGSASASTTIWWSSDNNGGSFSGDSGSGDSGGGDSGGGDSGGGDSGGCGGCGGSGD